MSELWGFAAGHNARRESDARQAMADLAIRKGNIDIAQSEVALEGSQVALDAQKRMIELMRQKTSDREAGLEEMQVPGATKTEMNDIPAALEQMAQMAIDAGLPQQAAEYASKASTMRSNASEIKKRALDERIANLTLASNLLSTVNDERSWREANALYSMTTGQPSPFAELPFNPATVAQIRDSVISDKERAETDAASARADASRASVAESQTRSSLYRAQEDLARARTAALKKVGGKPPKADDVRAVTDLIMGEYMGSLTAEDARVLARPIAERASALMAEEDLTRSQAAERAFTEAKASGDFAGLRPRTHMRGNAKNPLDMPSTQEELRPNMVYKLGGKHTGKVGVWTGTGFKIVDPATAPSIRGGAGNEADFDDEGDEEDEGYDNEHTDKIDEGA